LGLPSQLPSSPQHGPATQLGLPSQLPSSPQHGPATQHDPPLPLSSNWHHVKIISPAKGQQVPIGKDLLISGISSANGDATTITTSPNTCKVYVIVNGVKPYQLATGAGPGGAADYTRWNFVLSPTYTTIKQGSHNKITAKYFCGIDPRETSFYSTLVTGVSTTITPVNSSPHTINPSHSINTASSIQQVVPKSTPESSIAENRSRTALSSSSMNFHGNPIDVHTSSSSLVESSAGNGDVNSGFNPYIFPFEP
ncbi:MAG: hypothetical protein JO297_00355, partial [Nitrososphaeraceae archaeon]|nr:hypothetical protein [Nitrososphaeraceae archaeon]